MNVYYFAVAVSITIYLLICAVCYIRIFRIVHQHQHQLQIHVQRQAVKSDVNEVCASRHIKNSFASFTVHNLHNFALQLGLVSLALSCLVYYTGSYVTVSESRSLSLASHDALFSRGAFGSHDNFIK